MQLVQLETRPQQPKPPWLRVKLPTGKTYSEVKSLVATASPAHRVRGGDVPEHR